MAPEEVVRAILAPWDHLDADEVMNWFAVDVIPHLWRSLHVDLSAWSCGRVLTND